jgi:cobalt-zinc-cadmium efflux system protein
MEANSAQAPAAVQPHLGPFQGGLAEHRIHGNPAAFGWSVVLNALLIALQLGIGLAFGSLALVGEALHKLIDVACLLLGWGAEWLSLLPPGGRFTWGLGRTTHLAVLVNASLILLAGLLVVWKAIERLGEPVAMEASPVIWAALTGIAVNLLSARLFGEEHHHDLNRRAAVVHLLTDAAVMGAVLLSAVLVAFTGLVMLDSITAIGVGLVVAWSGFSLLREAVVVSLDGVPADIDLAAIEAALRDLPEVQDVRELHVWGLSTARTALSAHIQLAGEDSAARRAALLLTARQRLTGFGISSSTLELQSPEAA